MIFHIGVWERLIFIFKFPSIPVPSSARTLSPKSTQFQLLSNYLCHILYFLGLWRSLVCIDIIIDKTLKYELVSVLLVAEREVFELHYLDLNPTLSFTSWTSQLTF